MDTLAWFFFKLLIFGYVEDLETGIAFQLPGGLHWKIFVEVNAFMCNILSGAHMHLILCTECAH